MRTSALLAAIGLIATAPALAETGITDKEIKIGQTMPYSGPASAYGAAGRTETAYYNRLNATKGGIHGRKVNFLTYDDAYSPPKTVEQTRKLVEQDEIFANFGSLGTATNTSIHKYMNQKKVPHLFLSTGADKWNDPKNFPYTMALYPSYTMEARVAAKYILQERPNAKIAVLSQNDDAGRDYVRGFKEGLGDKVSLIVKEVTYEVSDPTIDSQMVALRASGADTLFNMTTPKFSAQSIRKAAELGWKPLHYIVAVGSSIKTVLEPAGLENSKGLITAIATKIPADPRWANDKETQDYLAFMKEWGNNADPNDGSNTTGYNSAWLTEKVLTECGKDCTREKLMKVVSNLKDVQLPLGLPGVTLSSSPTNYSLYDKLQISRFDGRTWEPIGPVISGALAKTN